MDRRRRPKGFKATTWMDAAAMRLVDTTADPLGFLDLHEAWDEVDWTLLPGWLDDIREAEANLRVVRQRLEALQNPGRICESCGQPIAGRADRRYCSSRCRVRAHRGGPPT